MLASLPSLFKTLLGFLILRLANHCHITMQIQHANSASKVLLRLTGAHTGHRAQLMLLSV